MKKEKSVSFTIKIIFNPAHMFLQFLVKVPTNMQEDLTSINDLLDKEAAPTDCLNEMMSCILQLPSGATIRSYKVDQDGMSMKVIIEMHKLMWHHQAIDMAISQQEPSTVDPIEQAVLKVALKAAINKHNIKLDRELARNEMMVLINFIRPVDRDLKVRMKQYSYGMSTKNKYQLAFAFFYSLSRNQRAMKNCLAR